MPAVAIPSIDNAACTSWTEQDINLFNKYQFFFAVLQAEKRKRWNVWAKNIGKVKWTPNHGDTMKGIRKEPSPRLRQFAFPQLISAQATKDINQVREITFTAQVKHQKFETPIFQFLSSFQDFMKDHVEAHVTDLEEKKIIFEECFYRGYIFHQSPYMYIAGKAGEKIIAAPQGDGNSAGTSGKTTAFLAAQQALVGGNSGPGNLSLLDINLLATIMENDLRIPPFSGGGQPKDDATPGDMFRLILSTEAWNQFPFDPFLKENRAIDLNIVTAGLRGNFFGRVTCQFEDTPLRMLADGTFPAPEITEINPDRENYGESVANPAYTHAPFEFAFMMGPQGYKAIDVGPPPKAFANGEMPKGFGSMFWNGETILTTDINIPCVDQDGNTTWETNAYGEYVRAISHATYGIIGHQKRNVVPVLFRRRRNDEAIAA